MGVEPLDEVGQGGADVAGVGTDDGVRPVFDDDEGEVLGQCGQPSACELDGQDPVLVTLDDQDPELMVLIVSSRRGPRLVVTGC
jgi:hypothetical protein